MFWYTFYKRHIWIGRAIFLFFMGLIVAFVVALRQIDLENLRGNIIGALRDATNMPIEINGNMSWHFSLRPEIEFNDVRIPNADWAKNKDLFSAKKIDVRLDLLSLFKTKPVIRYIKVYDVEINVEKNKKTGQNSIVFNYNEKLQTSQDALDTADKDITKYPFHAMPFSGLEIQNIVANIYGDKYSLGSFGIHNHFNQGQLEYTGWVKPYKNNLPFVVKFSEYDIEREIYPVQIAFATGGDALIADITLDKEYKLPRDFVMRGEIPNLKKSGDWFKINTIKLPNIKVDVAGTLAYKKITFYKSSIAMGNSDITFSGSYDWTHAVPVINAKVYSGNINLYKSFPDWFGVGKNWVHPNRDLNVFHDMPLAGDFLYNLDANVDINLNHFIVYRGLDLSNTKLKASVKNHTLRADAQVNIASGKIDAVIVADIDKSGVYTAQAAAFGKNVMVGEILKQIKINNIISGLPLDVQLYLVANGADMSQIMRTLTGPVIVYSTDKGFAHADLVEYMYGGDFLTTLRHSVEDLLSGNKRDMIQIDGAIANVKLRNGLIETKNGVAVETHVINMWLAGVLGLGQEKNELSLGTVPVGGVELSLTGNVVNALQISGNLAEPDFKIDGGAIAGKVGSAVGLGLLLSPLTGGLSIAGGLVAGLLAGDLLEGWLADDHPYETAMKKGAPVKRDDPQWFRQSIDDLSAPLFEAHRF